MFFGDWLLYHRCCTKGCCTKGVSFDRESSFGRYNFTGMYEGISSPGAGKWWEVWKVVGCLIRNICRVFLIGEGSLEQALGCISS